MGTKTEGRKEFRRARMEGRAVRRDWGRNGGEFLGI
jgi:hypothetical protein